MKKITSKRFNESYIEETLDNGLKVILWQKPNYKKSNFIFGTPFGGRDSEQFDDKGNIHSYPHGVAHFLEHKMFENEEKDVMEEFSSMGANVNAFTSYNETAYYFSTTNDPIKPLHLLLDFVQKLSISEQSVEKEKGIIIQELEMYKQMSDARLYNEAFESIFEVHPLRNDIGGSAESVNAITYDILHECYNINYHPSNMILVGVSAYNPKILLQEIKNNQSAKQFPVFHKPKRVLYESEMKSVHKDAQTIQMDISTNKVADVYKFEGIKDAKLAGKVEWGITLLLDIAFSSLSSEFQSWIDEEIINDSFGYEIEIGPDYGILIFTNETDKVNEFFELIQTQLQKITAMDLTAIEQLKRKYFGSSINSLNSFESISVGYMRSFFQKINFFDSLEEIEHISASDALKAFGYIDIENHSKIVIEPKS